MDVATLQMLKDGFTMFREAIGLAKDAKGLLPAPQQEALAASIERADRAATLAEAQIAMGLGYLLHRCTFPPQIMRDVQTPQGWERQCPACGYTTSDNIPPEPMRIRPHNF
jgi:hypothetical protein